jgi:hypothetical protein
LYLCGGNAHAQLGLRPQTPALERQTELVMLEKHRIFTDSQQMKNCKLRIAAGECHTLLYFSSDRLNMILTHFYNLQDERLRNFADVTIITEEELDAEQEGELRGRKRQRITY